MKKIDFKRILIILSIFLLAFYIRVYKIELARFGIDQSSHFEILYNFAVNGELPEIGAYVGFTPARLGPFHYYLFLLSTLYSTEPVAAYIFAAFLNALAVPLIFMMCRGRYDFSVPVITSFFYALSPYMVYVSREFWTLVTMPFFVTLLLYFLFNMVYEKRVLSGISAIITVFIISQLHITGAIYIIIPVYILLVHYDLKNRIIGIAGGVFLGILTYLPWIYHQLNHGFADIIAYSNFIFNPDSNCVSLNFAALPMLFEFPLWFTNYVDSFKSVIFMSKFYIAPVYGEQIIFFLSVIFMFYSFLDKKDKDERILKISLVMFLFLPVVLLTFFRYELYDRHLLIVFPLPFLFCGIFYNEILKKSGKIISALLILLLFSILFMRLLHNFEFYRQVEKTAFIGGEIPLKWKKWILENVSGRYEGVSDDDIMSVIHPIETMDTATDFRVLHMITRGDEFKEHIDSNNDHYMFFRENSFDFLKTVNSEETLKNGPVYLCRIKPSIDYSELKIRYLKNFETKFKKMRNPHIETEDESSVEVKGNIKFSNTTDEVYISVFTNLPIYDFRINNMQVKATNNYLSQGETSEVHASERLFEISQFLGTGENEFVFKAGPATRWYNLNIYDFSRRNYDFSFDLLKQSEIEKWRSENGEIKNFSRTSNLKSEYVLKNESDYVYFEFIPVVLVDWQDYSSIKIKLRSDGKKALLRLMIKEIDGEEWIMDDYNLLSSKKEETGLFSFKKFKNPPWGKRVNGIFEPDKIKSLSCGFHYFRENEGDRKIEINSLLLLD